MYRLQFEAVLPMGPGAKYYYGEKPICRPEEVTDEAAWVKSDKTVDYDPWEQYRNLKRWAETGEQLIRNVKLFEAGEPTWKEVTD